VAAATLIGEGNNWGGAGRAAVLASIMAWLRVGGRNRGDDARIAAPIKSLSDRAGDLVAPVSRAWPGTAGEVGEVQIPADGQSSSAGAAL
jgi:hypothetical protein